MTPVQMKKAIEFVSGGGDIKAIEAKYIITVQQGKDLEALNK